MMTDRSRFIFRTSLSPGKSVSAPISRIKNVPIAKKEKSRERVGLVVMLNQVIPVNGAVTPESIPIRPTVKRAAVPAGSNSRLRALDRYSKMTIIRTRGVNT